ncbi:tetratricopeptide repeat protein 25-like isoform X2 [Mizuhopecten yessoensis]|uniref:tetratricopeptide repeat protein 25-like isoform X2 n=1 Tax=Mizuhopecten yessoensis TaxID=6573 RepID=UPI000B459644|nr:tetratricopeptide repeat protein 25-like isoform X2 [Mizuhopecten yessoensis]
MPGRRKGRDDSDMGSEKDETGSFETLRDEGMYFVHVQLYQKAVESFTRASEMNPEDNVVLVTRAKCYLQLGMAENALADAEQALSHDKDYIRGLLMKAEALYQLGHFETALVFFHRGHKLRQELGEFRLGIQKAQEAINNSIGGPSSVKLDTTGDLTFFDKQENPVIEAEPTSEDENNKSKKPPAKTYGKPGAQKATQKDRERPKSAADTKTIKQLLEELYSDKTYLEKLLNDENLTAGRSYMEREIKGHICDGLEYLNNRADFWRQQKPMYARKRDRLKMRRSGKSRPRDAVHFIMQNLEDIDEAQADGRYEASLNIAKKLMKTVKDKPEEELANKWEIIANIHSQMGNAYLEMSKYTPAIENHEQDLDIAESNGLEDAKSRALDNIGRVHARRGDFEKAIKVWEKKLPLSKSPLEKTWLFHEIGRCHLENEQFDKAKEYGEKSLTAAKEADDDGWQLHATVLVAQAEVKSLDYSSAQTSFEEALELAKRLEDDAALNAVNKALEEVKEKIAKGYRAGEDDGDDEVDAKKVDYRPGEDDDGRKSAQSKDSKKIRAGEDEDEGRKSRASSKAGYEDDFEEDKGVKEEIIDKAPSSPTRRSEGSGRRSVEASSPYKRSPLHSPTKRSLAGSPTKRSAQPSPSKMSQSSRRHTYSPTKQSREVSFKEGSAKGSMKGSAKGSAGGRSAPGSAQQRASPAAGGSAPGSARGSAKGSVGAFAATTEDKDETAEIPDETTHAEEEKSEQKAASPAPADTATKEEVVEDEPQQIKGQD